jgi:hypothetical protein
MIIPPLRLSMVSSVCPGATAAPSSTLRDEITPLPGARIVKLRLCAGDARGPRCGERIAGGLGFGPCRIAFGGGHGPAANQRLGTARGRSAFGGDDRGAANLALGLGRRKPAIRPSR